MPKQYATRQVAVDLVWPELNVYDQTSIQSVPDAADGKALVLEEDGRDKGALVFGYYDGAGKRFIHNITISRDKVPHVNMYVNSHKRFLCLTAASGTDMAASLRSNYILSCVFHDYMRTGIGLKNPSGTMMVIDGKSDYGNFTYARDIQAEHKA